MSAIMIYVMAALNYGVRTGDVGTARNYVLFDWPLVYVIGMICDLCTSLHHLPTIRATILIQIHASQRHGMIAWAIAMLQPLGLVEREFRAEKLVNEDASLITIYYGQDTKQEDADALGAEVAEMFSDLDVEVQYGGQPLYYYLISAE